MTFAMDLVGYNTACEDVNNGDNKDYDDNLKLWISK